MFNPNKSAEEDKKPGMVVSISMGKPKGFNPNRGEDSQDEAPAKSGDPDQLMDQAAEGICDALNVSTKAAPRLREYLEAFIYACESRGEKDEPMTESEEG